MLCEQRPRVTGSVALHGAPGSRFASFGFHDFMPHTQCDVQEQLHSVDKELVAAMVVMIVVMIVCLVFWFIFFQSLPWVRISRLALKIHKCRRTLGFIYGYLSSRVHSRYLFSKFRLFVPCRMPGLTSEVWAKVRSHLGTNRQNKSKWDWGSCLFDQIAWRSPWISAVTFLLFRHNTISQWSNETRLCLCVCTTIIG